MSNDEQQWLERRRDTRYSVDLRVRIRITGKEKFSTLEAKDISRGGMFLATIKPIAVGTRVSIELTHGRGYSMLLPGEVVRIVDASEVGEASAGVGVRIGPLSDAEQEILDVFIEETGGASEAAPAATAAADGPLEGILACHERVRAVSPAEFFGVDDAAPPTAKRLAYQAQIKQWHPSNFIRQPREVLEAATALCRTIRTTYDRWSASAAS